MAIAIKPYTEEQIRAVRAFNLRLAAGGIPRQFHFPESNVPDWLPKCDGRRIYQEYYLAVDGDSVRGGFILKHQDFCVGDCVRTLAHYRLPVSEGIVNRTYASVGVHMLRSALQLQPMLFALGMGGYVRPLPQMLKSMGWGLSAVPFYFRVNHPKRFLREIFPLRKSPALCLLANIAAVSGVGWLGIKALHVARTRSPAQQVSAERIDNFGSWADDLWQQSRKSYSFIALRDSETLNVLYPSGKNFICLKITRRGELLGWAVILDTQMQSDKYFGNLRLGSIVDALALPGNAAAIVHAAAQFLESRGVDLTISNQAHKDWTQALKTCGFLQASSNFIFAASKPLMQLLTPHGTRDLVFLNRGDGDGPVNL